MTFHHEYVIGTPEEVMKNDTNLLRTGDIDDAKLIFPVKSKELTFLGVYRSIGDSTKGRIREGESLDENLVQVGYDHNMITKEMVADRICKEHERLKIVPYVNLIKIGNIADSVSYQAFSINSAIAEINQSDMSDIEKIREKDIQYKMLIDAFSICLKKEGLRSSEYLSLQTAEDTVKYFNASFM